MTLPITTTERVVCYVDGFNLYFGLRESQFQRYYWLNLFVLAGHLLRRAQTLIALKYFTARVSSPPDKQRRQATFLEALQTVPGIEIFEGHYLAKQVRCRKSNAVWTSHEEKMTDVQIATELLADAYQDRFDTALLISADSDLVPPVRAIRKLFPNKRVLAAFPPKRFSQNLKQVAHVQFTIGRANLAKSQFPDSVTKVDGHVLIRPSKWK